MATQKTKPDPGVLERHMPRQQRRQTYRKAGTYALVTAVVVVVTAAAFAVWTSEPTRDPAALGQPSASVPAEIDPVASFDSGTAVPAPEKVDYLLDLKTGETTRLPWRIRGTGYSISPDGAEVAYYRRPRDAARPRERQVFVAHLDGTRVRQISHEGWAGQPAWSPDGETIAYVGRRSPNVEGNIFVIDLTSGATTQVTFETGVVPEFPRFSPDGSSIVYTASQSHGDESDQVRIVPVTGGKGRRLVGAHGSSLSGASLSPDGTLLSYVCDGRLCLAHADGSDATRSLRDAGCKRYLYIDACVIDGGTSPFGVNTASWSPDGSRLAYMDYEPESVKVFDVTTGEMTSVAKGAWPHWVDDRTLIVEVCNCPH